MGNLSFFCPEWLWGETVDSRCGRLLAPKISAGWQAFAPCTFGGANFRWTSLSGVYPPPAVRMIIKRKTLLNGQFARSQSALHVPEASLTWMRIAWSLLA
jgi:hypothetical protein